MTITTNEIEHQAEAHRANISDLFEELRARATPGEVIDQFLGWDEGHEVARTFGRQIKSNPLPLALVGAGLAWLMLSDSTQRRDGSYSATSVRVRNGTGLTDSVSSGLSRAGDSVSDTADSFRSAASGVGESVSGTVSRISDSASSAADYGRQKASDLAGTAQSAYASAKDTVSAASDNISATAGSAWQKTTQFTQSAMGTVRDTGSNLGNMAQEQPLLAGGLGFALGMALGALIPVSETENSLFGEQSDAVKEKAGELADTGCQKAKAVAQRSFDAATDAAKDEAQNQGLAPDYGKGRAGSGEMDSGQQATYGRDSYGDRSHGENNGGDYGSGDYRHH